MIMTLGINVCLRHNTTTGESTADFLNDSFSAIERTRHHTSDSLCTLHIGIFSQIREVADYGNVRPETKAPYFPASYHNAPTINLL